MCVPTNAVLNVILNELRYYLLEYFVEIFYLWKFIVYFTYQSYILKVVFSVKFCADILNKFETVYIIFLKNALYE